LKNDAIYASNALHGWLMIKSRQGPNLYYYQVSFAVAKHKVQVDPEQHIVCNLYTTIDYIGQQMLGVLYSLGKH
jgi:hypothetical protein